MFDELKTAIKNNIQFIKQSTQGFTVSFGGLDPNQALISNQHQLLSLCSQIERSANTGIGYAFSIEHLASETIFHEED